jgi:predicted amidophosphoribosyltransferase
MIVDDVFTTGATLNECAKLLKEAGAKEVWGLVIAKG